MNKGYTYIDGKVIISDENGTPTHTEYYDNLDKVLVQENVIEEMEDGIKQLTEALKEYPESKKRYIPTFLYSALAAMLIAPPVLSWMLSGNPYLGNIDTIFGSIKYFALITGIYAVPVGTILTLADYSEHRARARKGKGISSELEFLKSQIEKEKEILASLQEEKTRNNENTEFRSTKVDDKQQLEALWDDLKLYYDLGANGEKYYRYYQQGKLDKKLQKYYSETGVELAKEYLEKKGPVLVRKRDNK